VAPVRLRKPLDVALPDVRSERVRRAHAEAIEELQGVPLVAAALIKDVSLADATDTPIAHGQGRPVLVFVSPVRGASTSGRVTETRSATYDRSKFVVLRATGFGATVTVDLLVV
jgi:hypothetical protein